MIVQQFRKSKMVTIITLFPNIFRQISVSRDELSTCHWVVGVAKVAEDLCEFECGVSGKGPSLSHVREADWKRHQFSVCGTWSSRVRNIMCGCTDLLVCRTVVRPLPVFSLWSSFTAASLEKILVSRTANTHSVSLLSGAASPGRLIR